MTEPAPVVLNTLQREALENTLRWRHADVVIRFLSPILLACCGWLFMDNLASRDERAAMRERLSLIEATRFTREDGNAAFSRLEGQLIRLTILAETQAQEIKELRVDVARLKQQVTESPPR